MIFAGFSNRFRTENGQTEQEIEAFREFCVREFGGTGNGAKSCRGLKYNRTAKSVEYVIEYVMETEGTPDALMLQKLRENYPKAEYKKVLLPDDDWQAYVKADDVCGDNISGEEDFPAYEIDCFSGGFPDKILVCREYLPLETIKEDSWEEVLKLYAAAIGSEGCLWNANYPNEKILREDMENGDLYGIRDAEGRLVAAVAKDRDAEVEALDCWNPKLSPAAELARLVVAKEYQNQGIARVLLRQGMKKMAQRGFRGVHFLAAIKNERALRSYEALGFTILGEIDLHGIQYFCYEKAVQE